MIEVSIAVTLIPFAAYLLGSIPFGLLLAKLLGVADVRKAGSGNIGATNVARVVGPLAGIFTLVFDTAKGATAVWLAGRVTDESATWMMIAAFVVLLGHCFPVWLKFKGGKGVATALGVFLALCPLAAVSALVLFVLCVAYWRFVSLGSIAAAAAMPLLIYFLWAPRHAPPIIVDVGTLAIALLVIYKHDGNLQRLVEGTEPRFSFSKKKETE
ncbi:MAG: acyl-phosphate glycerol 3-phosphate acyltransferase [Acidobacteria bacterium]|nr:MAG: acyl-phosphate glycerol 3-phosphate acyltransferase [Acidobacteriota bacterium]